ncbi:MAG: 16S rRNA (guanine(966)-N(2))-methyltransferase RsmD [Micropruina sp.]|uniref:16S rRNA (guanine(966)-N(2))-methyltransferase RsmD n=1 Tax=Micropruina sp. TaxID=2737536 RepID=UPI0039E51DC9
MSRIIAGSRKGHRLLTPPGDGTRPTSDRVREAAFGVLASELGRSGDAAAMLTDRSFLDLYAGSGAVALEAASRGAASAVAVENDRRAADVIRRNVRETGLDVRLVATSVEKYLAGPPTPFDICWLDPPYRLSNTTVEGVLGRLVDGWLAPEAIVVVERARRDQPFTWPDRLGDRWERRYGETTLFLATEGGE